VDSNVFNTTVNPQRDYTATLTPSADAWFRAGRSLTAIQGRLELVYFQKFASERSVDGTIDARFEVRGNRVTPWIAGGFTSGRQRVGYEIDLRSRRIERNIGFGVEGRISAKTSVVLSASRIDYGYDVDAFFLGSSLRETLDRTSDAASVGYRQALSVYTTAVLEGEARKDRFEFAPQRDTDSVRVSAGLDFDDRALIDGRIRIGYRKFDGLNGLPRYTGLVAAATSGVTLRGRTRLTLEASRDVNYSYDRVYPYYVQTGATLTVTPRLTNQWDVQARVGGQRLAYRTTSPDAANRVDRYMAVGGGIGYHIGSSMRLGINLDRQRRSSPLQLRDFRSYRFGAAVTYGQ
ncbi:MAG: outer membrane beta-barrel protein, partial [Vicinamibacterales bacterium]